jgi:hypothetical protein
MSREWMLHVGTEWIVILVVLKALTYLVNDPAQLFRDIPMWQKDFVPAFFTIDYALSIGVAVFSWVIASFFSDKFQRLENDPGLMEQERKGYLVVNREQARFTMISMIFVLGGVMLLLSTINNAPVDFLAPSPVPLQVNVVILMMFFFMGLVLLSQSQYSILNAHWFIESIPSSPKISRFWFPASLILLAAITLVVIFLPTRYSLGLLDLVNTLVGILLTILAFLQVVILAPLIALLALLSRLLGFSTSKVEAPAAMPAAPPPPQPPSTPVAWWELVKSIIFWLIFVSVIYFALRYYISQHPDLLSFFTRLGIGSKLKLFWRWLKSGLQRVNQGVASVVASGLERLRSLRPGQNFNFNPFDIISRNLPPRQRILLTYLAMLHYNSQYGIQRRKSQTPFEYARMLSALTPDIGQDLEAITVSFVEARYTRHNITKEQASATQDTWDNLQKTLKPFFEQEKQSQV